MKKLLGTIFALTVIDVAFTVMGLKLQLIEEANPLLRSVMACRPVWGGIALCIMVGGALYFIYRVRNRVRWLKYVMPEVLAAKLYVLWLHISWITEFRGF